MNTRSWKHPRETVAFLTAVLLLPLLAAACQQPPSTPTVAFTATPLPTATAAPAPSPTPTATLKPTPSSTPTPSPTTERTRLYSYSVVRVYPHDPSAFTQGLVFENGFLYEGTGLNGQSVLRKVELATGKVLQERKLPEQYFGEGIAVYKDKIIQLTWQSHTGFVYDKATFEPLGQFSYPTEGWGLTFDGTRLIMSDGTATLHFLDPDTFAETGTIQVRDDNSPVTKLNELEYIRGEVYANVWQTDRIAIISPQTGRVTGWIDLKGLLSKGGPVQRADVLNGIAYDEQGNRLFVTGKLWPYLFEITLVPSN